LVVVRILSHNLRLRKRDMVTPVGRPLIARCSRPVRKIVLIDG
jgi:hypothetical protein